MIGFWENYNYGLMMANFGEEVEYTYRNEFDTFSESYNRGKQKRTYFSSPEISLGLYVKLGGTKKDVPTTVPAN